MIKHLAHHRIRLLLLFIAILIVFGTGLFMILENWTLIDAFYFTVSTFTTVGFGDVIPTTPVTRFLATLYMLLTVPTMIIALGVISESIYYEHHPEHIIKKTRT